MLYLEFDVFSKGEFIKHMSFKLDPIDPHRYALAILDGYTHPLFPNDYTLTSISIVEK